MPSPSRPKPANGPDLGIEVNSLISLSLMPWVGFQSLGHLEVSSVQPPAPWYSFGLLASWPKPVLAPVALGITSPGVVLAADAVVFVLLAVVLDDPLASFFLLLLPHAALNMASVAKTAPA